MLKANEIQCKREAECISQADKYSNPQNTLKIIGVTGTNGKTTVTSLIAHILNCAGKKCAVCGTLDNTGYTTAPPKILYKQLNEFLKKGYEYVAMEVSSHGLHQKRVAAITFCCGIVTNITREHLDYHKSMDAYIKAKSELFLNSMVGIINVDSAPVLQFKELPKKAVTYGIYNDADFKADIIALNEGNVVFNLKSKGKSYRVEYNSLGIFSVYNCLAAIAGACSVGVSAEACIKALSTFGGVAGRLEKINIPCSFKVYVDYAHTPNALYQVINALKPHCTGRLILVFGCGGNRDRGKRPQMLNAAKKASFIIITSDNPRTESPSQIIADILKGAGPSTPPFVIMENRKKAIEFAVNYAQSSDIVLIAGKGHERYLLKDNKKIPFIEKDIIENAAKARISTKGESV